MGLEVDRPKGAPLDVAELEYCSALRQTDTTAGLRSNGSLTANDVRLHLVSRHGIRVPLERIERDILLELAGGQEFQVSPDPATDKKNGEGSSLYRPKTGSLFKKSSSSGGGDGGREGVDIDPMAASSISDDKHRRVTPLDLVQQASLLMIPELKKLALDGTYEKTKCKEEDEEINLEPTKELNSDDRHSSVGKRANGGNGEDFLDEDVERPPTPSSKSGPETVKRDGRPQLTRHNGDGSTKFPHWETARNLFRPVAAYGLPTAEPSVVNVALLVLLEAADLSYGCELNVHVVQQLLLTFGEEFWPEDVIEQMIHQASGVMAGNSESAQSATAPVLDRDTFLKALTADLNLYDEHLETQLSTHFDDANHETASNATERSSAEVSDKTKQLASTPALERIFTASSIDYTADTYASFSWAIFVWFLLAGFFFSYIFDGLGGFGADLLCTGDAFGCTVANALIVWLAIMLKLCLAGFLYISLATLGNSVYLLGHHHKWKSAATTLVSMAVVVFTTMVSYTSDIQTPFFDTVKVPGKEVMYIATVVVGSVLLLLQVIHLIRILLPHNAESLPRIFELIASSATALERKTKEAAAFKVRNIMEHAASCHRLVSTPEDDLTSAVRTTARNGRRLLGLHIDGRISHALYQYQHAMMETELVGGLWWTVRSFWSHNALARQEGIWVFPRLLWCHTGQWCVCAAIIVFWLILVNGDDITSEWILIVSIGAVVALFACLVTTILYIPSAVTTVLRFRSGIFGSLRDRSFQNYRFAQDSSTFLFGSSIWGLLFTGVICWAVVSGVSILFVLEDTREFMLLGVAQIIGVASTILLKMLVMQFLRASWFASFYRRRPAFANFFTVIIECWNVGLSSGYILARTLKLILLSIFYIGRIDTPFLADGVGYIFGTIALDGYSTAFRKDILSHEAHRHPYMERWALLYLLKLRHGTKFGTPAGAAWRILFTLALMPWLKKNRVHPTARKSWSTLHTATTELSYEDVVARNEELAYEVERLREEVQRSRDTKKLTVIEL